ncbi:hypothetical protein KIS4809_1911 [Bacillus sp. ZZV12-4809]|nr:hypothetical protein KIS4809_1911 [Bacillus sp. ZZV12-4809]
MYRSFLKSHCLMGPFPIYWFYSLENMEAGRRTSFFKWKWGEPA